MELHITSGEGVGAHLVQSGVASDVLVWRDVLYDGPTRSPGWPDDAALRERAAFLEAHTGGGLSREVIVETLRREYATLAAASEGVVLWFDACLFDLSMLCHILACLSRRGMTDADLICVEEFPGVVPFHGLGQLTAAQLVSTAEGCRPVTAEQFACACRVDRALARRDLEAGAELARDPAAPLPGIAAAMGRWLQEHPNAQTGRGRLEQLALDAVLAGRRTFADIYAFAVAGDDPPQFWGDTSLAAKLNDLARRRPPLVRIEGPGAFLPQWREGPDRDAFRIYPT